MKISKLLLVILTVLSFQVSVMFAATTTTNSGGQPNVLWEIPGSWSAGVPTAETDVYIRDEVTVYIRDGVVANAKTLTLATAAPASSNGTLLVSGSLTVAGDALVGSTSDAVGVMTMLSGSTVNLGFLKIGGTTLTSSYTGIVNIEGGLTTVTGDTTIGGNNSRGTLNISGGTMNAQGDMYVGARAGNTTGTLNMTGGELNMTSGKILYVGNSVISSHSVNGTASIQKGTINGSVVVGSGLEAPNAKGRLNIGASGTAIAGSLTVQRTGTMGFMVGGATFETLDMSAQTVTLDANAAFVLDLSQMTWRGMVGSDTLELDLFKVGTDTLTIDDNLISTGYNDVDFNIDFYWDNKVLKAKIVDLKPIPEPATYALIITMGVIAVTLYRRRR